MKTDPNVHGFALLPDNGPARLLRFHSLSRPDLLSELDRERNILRISAFHYDRLPEQERARLDVTHEVRTVVVDRDGRITFEAAPAEPVTHCH